MIKKVNRGKQKKEIMEYENCDEACEEESKNCRGQQFNPWVRAFGVIMT